MKLKLFANGETSSHSKFQTYEYQYIRQKFQLSARNLFSQAAEHTLHNNEKNVVNKVDADISENHKFTDWRPKKSERDIKINYGQKFE